MGQNIVLTGMVLKVMPIGDYDKRVTLLTREKGKITAFAKGARRQGSQLLAATNPFSFGEFELFEGKSTYNMAKASIQNYFRELSFDPETACYGFYFLEAADYYTQENNDEKEMLKLLYQSLRALESPAIPNRLIRCIYELKMLTVNGEYPNLFSCVLCQKEEGLSHFCVKRGGLLCNACRKEAGVESFYVEESLIYTMQYIITAKVEKLYTFTVTDGVLNALERVMEKYMAVYVAHKFKSLDILKTVLAT